MHLKELKAENSRYNRYCKLLEWPHHNFLTSKRTKALLKWAIYFSENFKNVSFHFSCDWLDGNTFEAEVHIYNSNGKEIAYLDIDEHDSSIYLVTSYKEFMKDNISLSICEYYRNKKGMKKALEKLDSLIKNSSVKPEDVFTEKCLKESIMYAYGNEHYYH